MTGTYLQKSLWLTALPGGSVILGMQTPETEFRRTLGATILELRVRAGIPSQAALAAALIEQGVQSCSEATVRRWERGTHSPDAWEINRLCALFGVEPVELIRPQPMTDREREVLRRAGRQIHRTLRQERGDAEAHG